MAVFTSEASSGCKPVHVFITTPSWGARQGGSELPRMASLLGLLLSELPSSDPQIRVRRGRSTHTDSQAHCSLFSAPLPPGPGAPTSARLEEKDTLRTPRGHPGSSKAPLSQAKSGRVGEGDKPDPLQWTL